MWLYTPLKSAQAWECLAKDCEPGSSTWAFRLAPSATSSGKHMPQQSWQRAAKKAAWTQLLCGPTYSPSTLQRGMALWIASSRDSRAKICPLRAAGLGLTESVAGSSSTFSTLPMLAVRGASFWRTSQESLVPQLPLWTKKAPPSISGITTPKAFRKWALKMAAYSKERLPESWENWPTAGGMRNGTLFQRPMWAPAMGGQGGSALRGDEWLTPNVPNGGRSVSAELVASKGMTEGGEKKTVGLESQTKHWATPNAHDGRRPGADLSRDAAVWPTPRGTDGTKGGPNQAGSKGDLMLPSAAAQWPTPNAHVIEAKSKPPIIGNRKPTDPQIGLADIAVRWPTPAARDSKGANSAEHALITGGGAQAHGPTEQLCRPLFAPGPTDPSWPAILERWPELAPAIDKATEPELRGVADGLASGAHDSRAARLRCIGNGVVALQAAVAVVRLLRRAGMTQTNESEK